MFVDNVDKKNKRARRIQAGDENQKFIKIFKLLREQGVTLNVEKQKKTAFENIDF